MLLMLALSLFAQGAVAAGEKKAAKQEAKYRQVTGDVVSVNQDSIVIKSRTKGTMTLAVTKTTDMIGQPAKTGDKATVNYREDKERNVATRITVKAPAKASQDRTAKAPPAARSGN